MEHKSIYLMISIVIILAGVAVFVSTQNATGYSIISYFLGSSTTKAPTTQPSPTTTPTPTTKPSPSTQPSPTVTPTPTPYCPPDWDKQRTKMCLPDYDRPRRDPPYNTNPICCMPLDKCDVVWATGDATCDRSSVPYKCADGLLPCGDTCCGVGQACYKNPSDGKSYCWANFDCTQYAGTKACVNDLGNTVACCSKGTSPQPHSDPSHSCFCVSDTCPNDPDGKNKCKNDNGDLVCCTSDTQACIDGGTKFAHCQLKSECPKLSRPCGLSNWGNWVCCKDTESCTVNAKDGSPICLPYPTSSTTQPS
jgi:hypothetical protein